MQKVVYYEEDHGKHFTSVFTCKLIYRESGRDLHELTEHNQSWYRLDRMKASRYDGIRENERFAAVIEKLESRAR